ncbi:MAG TPA: NAD(P)-dependent oxidoreductase [Candidatus Limnocylindrales bacterium]|nr:NAD(P)-dependent oxidoreductase [Candidatus Limnocylindrales bacterium]
MRVLVTGATGFIGSHVVRELVARGHDTFALVRPGASRHRLVADQDRMTVVGGDLGDSPQIGRVALEVRPDAIIHLAWYAEPGRYLHDVPRNLASLRGSIELLDAAVRSGCPRVVLAGTCLEDDDRPTRSIYEAAKRAQHALAGGFGARPSIACGHVFYLFGPGEDQRRVIPAVIRSLLRSEPIATTDGLQSRDYLHVADVASAFCALAEASIVGGVDICSGSPVRLRDLLDMIGSTMDKRTLIQIGALGPAVDEGHDGAGDPGRLRALGWAPRYDLDAAVRDSIAWWTREGASS